jgi:hypothetical protein
VHLKNQEEACEHGTYLENKLKSLHVMKQEPICGRLMKNVRCKSIILKSCLGQGWDVNTQDWKVDCCFILALVRIYLIFSVYRNFFARSYRSMKNIIQVVR